MSESLQERISKIVEAEPGITMAAVLQRADEATDGDLLKMIASRRIYVDLETAFLGEPERVRVFRSKAVAAVFSRSSELESQKRDSDVRARDLISGSTLLWNGSTFRVLHTSKSKIYLRSTDGAVEHYRPEDIERFINEGLITSYQPSSPINSTAVQLELEAKKTATDEEFLAALDREEIVLRMLAGEKVTDDDKTARKYRNWRTWYQDRGLAGLIFNIQRRGNKTLGSTHE